MDLLSSRKTRELFAQKLLFLMRMGEFLMIMEWLHKKYFHNLILVSRGWKEE